MNTRFAHVGFMMALILGSGVAARRGSERSSEPKAASLCELVEHWKDYNRQMVRVRAIYAVGAESEVLYDPACQKGKDIAYVRIRDDVKGPYKKLDRIVSKDRSHRRAWVIFEGVFRGPEPYTESELERTPPQIRDQFRRGHRRYGHMDMFDYMLEVTQVVDATGVPNDVPD
jgi:hypothetical protein